MNPDHDAVVARSTDDEAVDTTVCDCCQTSAVATPSGVVVSYRDRTADELRDVVGPATGRISTSA